MTNWQPIDTAPENRVVLTKIDDAHGVRNEQPLKRQGNLWWTVNDNKCRRCCPLDMYVYYTPTHWAELEDRP